MSGDEAYNRWLASAESIAARESLVRRLRDVGTGAIRHDFAGACPEAWDTNPEQFGDRDNLCEACVVLMEADQLLGDKVSP